MRKYLGILILMLCLFARLSAQRDTVVVSKNFQFEDGVYLSFEAFKNNKPEINWDKLTAAIYTNPQTFLTQVEYIKLGQNEQAGFLNIDSIWGLCLGGIPYVRLDKSLIDSELQVFSGLQLRGKICYYTFEKVQVVEIDMPVYNPITGVPFRNAKINRDELVVHKKILHFETGEVKDFNAKNLSDWIADDQKLTNTIQDLDQVELEEKLFKILLIYDDRNLVYTYRNRKAKED